MDRSEQQAQQPTPEPWPDGVIARYLTLGGATVDILAAHTRYEIGEYGTKTVGDGVSVYTHPQKLVELKLTARCTGCPDHQVFENKGLNPSVLDRVPATPYGRTAGRWAQAHAETCRALPRPASA